MTKEQEKLLKDYKKSNRVRKTQLIKKAGFRSETKYFEFLSYDPTKKVVKKTVPVKKIVAKKVVAKKVSKVPSEKTDYVIAFDTTGSMSSYIQSVKSHVETLVSNLLKNSSDLKIKIVAFGDYCDMRSATNFGNAYQESPLTDNKKVLIDFIKNAQNTGGGDNDEFYELVIKKINEETPWRNGKKAVLLIGDAPPHGVGYSCRGYIQGNTIDWRKEAQNAKKLGIQYDTLLIHKEIDWYKELSQITGGASMVFANANKISTIIEGTVYARSSSTSYAKTMMSVNSSGDSELIGAFKSLNTILD